jgi:hypothetical protein
MGMIYLSIKTRLQPTARSPPRRACEDATPMVQKIVPQATKSHLARA